MTALVINKSIPGVIIPSGKPSTVSGIGSTTGLHPGISVKPANPTSVSQEPLVSTPSVSNTPALKPSVQQIRKSPNAVHPKAARLVDTIMGNKVGTRVAHNVSVLDMSSDGTQVYPFLNHCDTCAWEGRYTSLPNAKANAQAHAGVGVQA